MKKIIVIILTVIAANTLSALAIAANHDTTKKTGIYKQVLVNGDEPAPPPEPAPQPAPAPPPEPKPY